MRRATCTRVCAGSGERAQQRPNQRGWIVARAMPQIHGTGGAATEGQPLYFVNAGVDVLCLGGASVLVYGLVAVLHSGERSTTVITLAYWLAWLVNWPHFAATSYRLYRSRANVERFPLTAIVIPLLLVGAVVESF